ncbi:hypothetical protein HYX14_02515 [Candidatus Woesearchaeota archaeon]|nr:hypothetical protein [Candidatus Woesearchaeota archaeon]
MTIFIVGQKKYLRSIGEDFANEWQTFVKEFNALEQKNIEAVADNLKILISLSVRKMMRTPNKATKDDFTSLISELNIARNRVISLKNKSDAEFVAGKKQAEEKIKRARALIQVVGKSLLQLEKVAEAA